MCSCLLSALIIIIHHFGVRMCVMCVYVQMCFLHVCKCMCVTGMHTCVYACEGLKLISGIFLRSSPPWFLRQVLSLTPKLTSSS